ncbi:hypothetical protein [Metabacillus fastidiosus]|uniref:hypothetical protein n=1 Tax=Metabacillus fastidiosus TaxID=1458 RepID=UPI002E1F066A|nr:hypothetical protein [Metabacillus fastidiosus]
MLILNINTAWLLNAKLLIPIIILQFKGILFNRNYTFTAKEDAGYDFLNLLCRIIIAAVSVVPKKLPKSELYVIALFSIILGLCTDIVLSLKYHFYGYFTPGIQLESSLVVLILFPSPSVLFMNFYPFKKSLFNQSFYIICWSIFCLLFDYASIASGYFYHNNRNY